MKSLKKTILISILLLTFVSSIALFFISVHESRKTIRTVFHDDMFIVSDRINDAIGEVIQEKFNFLEYVATLDELRSNKYDLQQKMNFLLPMTKSTSKDLLSISFLDANGDAYIGANMKMNFMSAPIVQMVLKENKTVMLGPSADSITKQLSVNIATPVKDYDNKIAGILLARLDCDFLCDISQRIRIGETGYAIIIDRATGNTIGAPQKEDVENQQNLKTLATTKNFADLAENMEKLLAGQKDRGYFTIGGVKRIMLYQPVKNTNWSVAIMANEQEFILKLKTMDNLLFISTFLILIISVIISLLLAKALNPLKKVGDAISEIATGNADLTKRVTIKKGKKEILDIVNGFNNFVEKLQEIVSSIKQSENRLNSAKSSLQDGTQDTSASITQIIANIECVNAQIMNQSSSVDETAGAVNEIASNIESLEKMILTQSEGVEQASSAVEQMVGNINSVNGSVDKMFDSFKELEQNATIGINTQSDVNGKIKQIEEESKMLQDANSAIASIASQTNLLAMNAAIEAAHAGEAGKGFSVVADEIRKLSETSTAQSKTIGEELKKIQESINTVVTASSKATSAFTAVSESIQTTDQLVRQIKNAMEEQQIGSKQITDALHSMNDSTIEVKSASAEMAEGNKHILTQINMLQDVTSMMKNSITEMSTGAQKINETGAALSQVSQEVTDSIDSIKSEIDLFKV